MSHPHDALPHRSRRTTHPLPRACAALLCVLGLLQACHRYPAPPRHPADDPAYQETLDLQPKGMKDLPPEAIKVLPGDELRVRAISAEETTYEGLVIDELGNVHVPLVGDVKVGGMTLTEAELAVQKALRRYDSVVRVSVQIAEPDGHRATVVGAVATPGVHTVTPGMRVAELMARAGGANQGGADNLWNVADLYSARIVRDGEILPISVHLALTGDILHNVRVRAGDHLYVPPIRGDTITILGEAAAPQVMLYRPQLRLSQALAVAGGLPLDARLRDVRIIRGNMDSPSIYKVSQRALARGEAVDVELAAGDIVFVGRRGLAEMREVLGAFGPIIASGLSIGLAIGLSNRTTTAVVR